MTQNSPQNLLKKIKIPVFDNKTKVIYTALLDGYDQLDDSISKESSFTYICFTDNLALRSKKWQIIYVDFIYRDPRRTARLLKLHPHLLFPNHEFSVWIDASCTIKNEKNLITIIESMQENMAIFKHPQRSCIYDEAEVCLKLSKDDKNLISLQIKRYKLLNYPKNQGLVATGILIRKHNTNSIISLMNQWHNEIDSCSSRDQLSFNFCSWSQAFNYHIIDGNIFDNPIIFFKTHKKWIFYKADGGRILHPIITINWIYSKILSRIKRYEL